MIIDVIIKNKVYKAELEDNSTSSSFIDMLPMTLKFESMEHEKYYYMNKSLPTNTHSPKHIKKGDIMLFGTDCLVLFYESFSTIYSYSRIGKIIDTTGLEEIEKDTNISITFKKS